MIQASFIQNLKTQFPIMEFVIFLLVGTLLPMYHAESNVFNPIEMFPPRSIALGHRPNGLDCLSWRLAVETNNLRGWKLVPQSCKEYIAYYMQGGQYRRDCEEVAAAAIDFAKSFKVAGDGKDIWVFDISETALSNLGYYNRSDVQFGTLPRNRTSYYEWVEEARADAVPGILNLYNTVVSLGFKTVFLTASSYKYEHIMGKNLRKVGYGSWTNLIFRGQNEGGMSFKSTKRTELVNQGYRIVGNVGDQWTDLNGPNGGIRTFKVPNPMYYVG